MIKAILTPFIALGMAIGSFFAPAPDENIGASETIPVTVAFFETTLASAITSAATTFTLTSATDADGNALASSTYAFVIDEGNSNEEIVLADCTATACTNAIRGVSVLTGTSSVTALQKAHRRGASIKITDAPILMILSRIINGEGDFPNVVRYDGGETFSTTSNVMVPATWVNSNFCDLFNGNTWIGAQTWTGNHAITGTMSLSGALSASSTGQFTGTTTHYAGLLTATGGQCSSASPDTQICDKAYIDGVAVAGASDANETTKGIVEEATVAEINAGTGTGGTGAALFMTPEDLASSKYRVPTATTVGALAGTTATTTITLTDTDQDYIFWVNGACDVSAAGAIGMQVIVNGITVQDFDWAGVSNTTDTIISTTYASSTATTTAIDITLTGDGNCTGFTDTYITYMTFN